MDARSAQETEGWAIGAEGVAPLPGGTLYALTGNGLEPLDGGAGAAGEDADVYAGGGGLLFDDGSVRIASRTVKVGLRYYYSARRDSSLEEAWLENATGAGFAFGYYDASRRFVPYGEDSVTDAKTIIMRPLGGTAVGVYDANSGEPVFSVNATGSGAYLAVHPLAPEGGESIVWFKQMQYYGDFAYADLGNGKLTVVNLVDIERYVAGVCAGEMGAGFPVEALKAQAVAARTYAMFYLHSGTYGVHYGFDLTADDYSQVYLGCTDAEPLLSAARETENQYLTYDDRIIEALFCAADGGETLNSEEAFASAIPYLRGFPDPYEGSAWTRGPFGHRVGMSQWGAYAMAKSFDKTYKDILGFYYTNVGLSYGYLAE